MKLRAKNSLLLVPSLACSLSAFAHIPYIEGLDFQEVYDVKAPVERSLALYMSFDKNDAYDKIRFTISEADLKADQKNLVVDATGRVGRKITFNTIVPRCSQYAGVLPSLALVGPAQAALSSNYAAADLPFAVEGADGVFRLTNSEQGKVFKEPIAGTSYWQGKEAELIVSEAGVYQLYVWNPSGAVGDYVLVFGDKELFGPGEIAQSARRISYLRRGLEIKDPACRKAAKS